ncbi:putative zinc-binding metallopeptidase [Acetobacter estunensis]|uniref:zinc-binding metallopeptidase family protein n=1 Tax=Acetobacter estunensis TaxID=104097 RepID=UPI001C2DDC7D|nr:putative zinc-binding peptidase [Acetobacter estunensis]
MKLFSCQCCEQPLFFENTVCESCHHPVGYLPGLSMLTALEPAQVAGRWHPMEPQVQHAEVVYCANHAYDVCNWLTSATDQNHTPVCFACRFNRTIPDLSVPGNLERWRKIEIAKHRLFYTLLRLRLPLRNRWEDPEGGLAFDFLDDAPDGSAPVMTGHDNGLITLAIREADDAERERMRVEMGEYYRTLLGHFRHEVGHYYWNLLVRDAGRIEACRSVFGDDREDYQQALQAHYGRPLSTDWREHYVSAYATAHPWEDFAETWAHYLHIVSTLETASAYGVTINPATGTAAVSAPGTLKDPYLRASFDEIMNAWMPLTSAVNSLNRSMGLSDFYPFVLTAGVRRKLAFIHALIRETQALR